jgi:hypothetical protein
MYLDFEELLATLNAHKVQYLVVGGYAVSFHAQPRATKDLDLLVKPDLANATALYRALAEFGAPLEGPDPTDFARHSSRAWPRLCCRRGRCPGFGVLAVCHELWSSARQAQGEFPPGGGAFGQIAAGRCYFRPLYVQKGPAANFGKLSSGMSIFPRPNRSGIVVRDRVPIYRR